MRKTKIPTHVNEFVLSSLKKEKKRYNKSMSSIIAYILELYFLSKTDKNHNQVELKKALDEKEKTKLTIKRYKKKMRETEQLLEKEYQKEFEIDSDIESIIFKSEEFNRKKKEIMKYTKK